MLFGSVLIPGAVADELLVFHEQLPSFILVRTVSEPDQLLPAIERLGKGETEAIQLAKEVGAELLITDDHKARAAAASLGLKCTGLLGLLVHAKQKDQLSSVRAMIDVLERKGGLYLSDRSQSRSGKNRRRISLRDHRRTTNSSSFKPSTPFRRHPGNHPPATRQSNASRKCGRPQQQPSVRWQTGIRQVRPCVRLVVS
jgi:predicted nucleic acid-binding protein